MVETSGCTKLSPKDFSMTSLMFYIMFAICVAANTPFKRDFKLSQNVISKFFGLSNVTYMLSCSSFASKSHKFSQLETLSSDSNANMLRNCGSVLAEPGKEVTA